MRRTAFTIEFEQVYLSRRSRVFSTCEACEKENARLPLIDAIRLLRGVLSQLEKLSAMQIRSDICLFCLCSEILADSKNGCQAENI